MRQRFDRFGDLNNRNRNNISMKFLAFVVIVIVGITYYLLLPNVEKKINKHKTFEEMLEYRNTNISGTNSSEDFNKLSQNDSLNNLNLQAENPKDVQFEIINPPSTLPDSTLPNVNNNNIRNSAEFNKLLDTIANYPTRSAENIQLVINKFLNYYGYPDDLVRVTVTDIDQSRAKSHDNTQMANFDFATGRININSQQVAIANNKEYIAILAHELDHFDKLANLCKSIGYNKFQSILLKNNIQPDAMFWNRAIQYAKDPNFDAKLYEDALTRLVSLSDLEMTSSYSDYYKISENMRNPLEVSAYSVSDSVYKHYNMPVTEGPIKKLSKKFNDVDNALNTLAEGKRIPKARIPLFDYFFSQAIIKTMPQFEREYQNCVNNRNGDLTSFWLAYEGSVSSFYSRGNMSQQAYNTAYSLLTTTENMVNKGITSPEILLAYKYKINTLKANLVYPKAQDNLRSIIVDYLSYLHREKIITDSENELQSILTLICIDNDLTTKNRDKEISLYYLNLPEEIKSIYNITSKKNKYAFIYNNQAFFERKKEDVLDETLLTDLLNENRIDVRVKP